MNQISNVEFRAQKIYKNKKGKFGLLIREIVSNAIHSVLIQQSKLDDNYRPEVQINIIGTNRSNEQIQITVSDNGEGFNTLNRKYFSELDSINEQKEDMLGVHPQGQGRLALIYFANSACYESFFKDDDGRTKKLRPFTYPDTDTPLFDLMDNEESDAEGSDLKTELKVSISDQRKINRANTFFANYSSIEKLKDWFIEDFFPFFIENEKLSLTVQMDGYPLEQITKSEIKEEIKNIEFEVSEIDETKNEYKFILWLMEKEVRKSEVRKPKKTFTCFVRQLKASLAEGSIEYEIDLPKHYNWFLTSEYFDKNVDQRGDKIEISLSEVEKIQQAICAKLDEYFEQQISNNRRASKENIDQVKTQYRSLLPFVENSMATETNRILNVTDIVDDAIDEKGKIEKKYWTNSNMDEEETEKLINSSLTVYVEHRKRVLEDLNNLIRKYDSEGDKKPENESTIHELIFKRGENLKTSEKINHLHNLWILDDRYTTFSEHFRGLSSRQGQELSDIYLWSDNPDFHMIKELLIIELKSTTKAHNAGDRYDSMIAQVKRYASDVYCDPNKTLGWNVDTNKILYSGVILASKNDIHQELNSNNASGNAEKIPFLESSYYLNERFSISNSGSQPDYKRIRLDILSYEDVYQLALERNTVFFKLLDAEYRLSNQNEEQHDNA